MCVYIIIYIYIYIYIRGAERVAPPSGAMKIALGSGTQIPAASVETQTYTACI